jgi:prepilin-type N-terminal cleavage/methylation domain-containing protein
MSPMPPSRRGHSLLEMVVALTLLGLVLAAVVGTTVRTWRSHFQFGVRADARAQLQAATHALARDLRGLSTVAGDVTSALARDSAIELRTIVGQGVVCDTGGIVAIQPVSAPDAATAPAPRAPDAGDTMWILLDEDTTAIWRDEIVTSARHDGTVCRHDGTALRISLAGSSSIPFGAPVRFTRQIRWSLYRNADGWFLGRREWNVSLGRFDIVQPVAGPLAPYGAAPGLELRYFDDGDAEIAPGALDTRRIARVDVMLRAKALTDSERISIAVGRTEATP